MRGARPGDERRAGPKRVTRWRPEHVAALREHPLELNPKPVPLCGHEKSSPESWVGTRWWVPISLLLPKQPTAIIASLCGTYDGHAGKTGTHQKTTTNDRQAATTKA
jgi:hypothetical protein